MSYGFVYIMSNASFPGLYKVGYTTGSPFKRAKELSASTSVPTPFDVICYAEYADVEDHETRVHDTVADLRVSDRREFFTGPFSRIYESVMHRGYSLAQCDHVAAPELWDEEHASCPVVGGFE
jgi:hypothetical protein